MLSAGNPRIKRLRRLAHHRRDREREVAFLLEGPTLVDDALAHHHPLDEIFAEGPLYDAYCERGVACTELAPGTLARVLDTVTPQPVVAVASRRDHTVDSVVDALAEGVGLGRCALVGVEIRDPGNGGTLVRSAEAAGIGAVFFTDGSIDPFAPKCVRASAGSVLHLPIVSGGDPVSVLEALRPRGMRVIGTAARAGTAYDEADLTSPFALLVGNETRGLDAHEGMRAGVDEWVHVPMVGEVESLNVAIAASVVCFEAARQTRSTP